MGTEQDTAENDEINTNDNYVPTETDNLPTETDNGEQSAASEDSGVQEVDGGDSGTGQTTENAVVPDVQCGDNESGQSAVVSKISVKLDVPLVPQPTDVSCWAAALAMVISARDKASYTVEDVASKANMDTKTGYKWDSIRNAVSVWQLQEEGPMSAMPDYWAGLLRAYGPLWIVEKTKLSHAVVLTGMDGDGTPELTKVTVNNPLPVNEGKVEFKTFLDFDREFGLAAGAKAMVVHR